MEINKAFDILKNLEESFQKKYEKILKEIMTTKSYKEVCYYNFLELIALLPDLEQIKYDLNNGVISNCLATERMFVVAHELGHATGKVLLRNAFKENANLTTFVRAVEEIVAEGISRKFREYCGISTAFNDFTNLFYQTTWYKAIAEVMPNANDRLNIISRIRDMINDGFLLLKLAVINISSISQEDDDEIIEEEENEQ